MNHIIKEIEELVHQLETWKKNIRSMEQKYLTSKSTKKSIRSLAIRGRNIISSLKRLLDIDPKTLERYNELFLKLLEYSLRTKCLRERCLQVIEDIARNIKKDILLKAYTQLTEIRKTSDLWRILENVTEAEKDYLEEAIRCAESGYLRAAVILGWNAAVDRMHKIIEKLGFEEFNRKSREMKQIKEGRYKRFNKEFNVHNLSELRATVFDKDLLWVLEYWGLIDLNQHERLSTCLTLRNTCAHPGEASITMENVLSFFSDIKRIIFDNEKFRI